MKRFAPVFVRRWLRRHFGWQWFRGDYPDWAHARAAAAGYDDAAVLAQVVAAVREVRAGRAAWERDGVPFAHAEINGPLLAVLRQAAQETEGRLAVIDFGGSLGSAWWQHRLALADIPVVNWRVVEQPHFVAAGREFSDVQLSFHGSLSGALAAGEAQVILLSSVLPYLESPTELLREVAASGCRHVVIDRTPLIGTNRTRLAVQHTTPELGGGSYPCWLFARETLLAPLTAEYRLIREWEALDDLSPDVRHRGFYFLRRER